MKDTVNLADIEDTTEDTIIHLVTEEVLDANASAVSSLHCILYIILFLTSERNLLQYRPSFLW